MTPRAICLLGLLLAVAVTPVLAAEGPPEPDFVIHVPADEMDVLLQADRRGVVLRHGEYRALLEAARARARAHARRAPRDAALLGAEGEIDLQDGRFEATWRVRVLVDGEAVLPFPFEGIALDEVGVEGGRYEELEGRGLLRLAGRGAQTVTVRGRVRLLEQGAQRLARVRLPAAAAMALQIRIPPAVRGEVRGVGAPLSFETGPNEARNLHVRPAASGRVVAMFEPAARGEDGPPVLDAEVLASHVLGEDLVRSRLLLRADVFRTPAARITLDVPPEAAIRAATGEGISGTRRSEDRQRLVLLLEPPRRGRVEAVIDLEMPYRPGPGTALPRVAVAGALRQRGEVALRTDMGVEARSVYVKGGRRLPAKPSKGGDPWLRYALARADADLRVDLAPTALRLEATSTWYLNLTEAAKTLLAAITYRVAEGRAFEIAPHFPSGYELTALRIDGRAEGFTHELRSDGTLEVRLARGVGRGEQILLEATLEQAGVDWVPERGRVTVPFAVPAAGAAREEGYVGVGADASFQVLDRDARDLVSVGAAELTARGVTPVGLVYGYRLDGDAPAVTLEVDRRAPRIEAEIVARVRPAPRRLDVEARVLHDIERSGVRRLRVDVPAWAGETVRIEGAEVVASNPLDAETDLDVPDGFARWEIVLGRRILGSHALSVTYHEVQEGDGWSVPADRPLAPRLPLDRVERTVVVERAHGLEVGVGGDLPLADLADLPAEAAVDPLAVREVVRLSGDAEGPGVRVRRHEGAPVLDAIARRVDLRTGVASEGILRTRARVEIVNVGLQFLRVALPRGGTLVGAVVDAQPVKPLVDGEGVLRIPIPPAHRAGAITEAHLTYETRLGGELDGWVVIPSPVFPGLEVIETTHEVAFDPALSIERVEGDYGALRPRGARFVPWIVQGLGGLAATTKSLSAPGADVAAPAQRRVAAGGARYGYITEDPAQSEAASSEAMAGLVVKSEEISDHVEMENDPPPGECNGEDAREMPPGLREPSDPCPPTADPCAPPGEPVPVPVAAGQPAGAPPVPGVEGPGRRPPPPRLPPSHARTKGLLSLDVPVLLSHNRLRGTRLGEGGAMVVGVVDRQLLRERHLLFTLSFLAVGLLFARLRRGQTWKAVVALLGVALAARVAFGRDATLVAAALVDAATVLVGIRLVAGLLRRTLLRRPTPAAAALLLALVGGILAPAARADERPAPPQRPRAIYVPYDPADPAVPRDDDRVYLPLDTWLGLRGPVVRAHEKAPVVVLGIGHRLRVAGDAAEVETQIDLATEGPGPRRFPISLGGIGITEAVLDGQPVRLLVEEGLPTVLIPAEGAHRLALRYRVPVVSDRQGRRIVWQAPASATSHLELDAPGFDGVVRVAGAAHVERGPATWHVHLGHVPEIRIRLAEPEPAEPEVPLRTRAESRTLHRVLEGGTETTLDLSVHVLQGEAEHVDISLPDDAFLLDAGGNGLLHWETGDGAVRLMFAEPVSDRVNVQLRVLKRADEPARELVLPELALRDTTGESGVIVVATDPLLRVQPTETAGLLRTATPRTTADPASCSIPPDERVAGAWRFAARPTRFLVRVDVLQPSLSVESLVQVVFGDDRVRTFVELQLDVDGRRPVGTLVLELPGEDDVLTAVSPGLETWWTEGQEDARRLFLRYRDLVSGRRAVALRLERRLGGRRDGVLVPRVAVEGATPDRGALVLLALPDVEIAPGALPGLRAAPLTRSRTPPAPLGEAESRHLFTWEAPLEASLPVALGSPALEVEAVVMTAVRPSDEAHGIEHLVVFDVRRGLADRFQIFVPDGGYPEGDLLRASDLREIRQERVTRRGVDGEEVGGTLHTVTLQAPRGGLVEMTVTQTVRPELPVRAVRPEGVRGVRWFALVGAFLDGEVEVGVSGADPAHWGDLPFLPAGLERRDVVRAVTARAPYALDVRAMRQPIELEADAVVRAAVATAVLGRDGQLRVRASYRLFNRRRQFLRVRLPAHALLYGVTVAGRPVRPLDGPHADLLVPVSKVPLGGAGYRVELLYRAPAGARIPSEDLEVRLPEIVDVAVDRTAVRLYLPDAYHYAIETDMADAEGDDLAADLAQAAVEEAQELLKVAEGGSLVQRRLAADNATQLVAQANDLNRQAGAKRQGLNRDVDQVQREVQERWKAIKEDVEASWRVRAGEQLDRMASNAYAALQQYESTGDAAQGGGGGDGQWVFNPVTPDSPQAGDEVGKLKQRLGKALERRGQRQAQQAADAYSSDRGGRAAQRGDKDAPDAARDAFQNFRRLNEALATEQQKQRQLGAVVVPSQRASLESSLLRDVGVDSRGLGPDAQGITAPPMRGTDPALGVFFNDGMDGDVRTRVENLFDQSLLQSLSGAETRRGLMGVWVDLPQKGRVFRFRSSGSGAPIQIDARDPGLAPGLKWVLFLVLVVAGTALAVGAGRWWSRR